MKRWEIDRAWRAGLWLAACFAISASTAAAVRFFARPVLLQAYSQEFTFVPGHRFGTRISGLAGNHSPTCIVLGVSTAREGFAADVLKAAMPGTNVVNAATTGGNNEVLEIQSAILAKYGIRPVCVIAGMSTWMLFRDGSPSIADEEYLGLLDWRELFTLSSRPIWSRNGPRMAAELAWPLRSQAVQLNRLIRARIMAFRGSTIGALPRARYEAYPAELQRADVYTYEHTAPHLMKDWGALVERSRSFYPASRYGGAVQERSFRATLDRLLEISPHVMLVIMPQTEILAPASRSGLPSFSKVVKQYHGKVILIDCSGFSDHSLFIDEGHLSAGGRTRFSREIGPIFQKIISGSQPNSTDHCSVN